MLWLCPPLILLLGEEGGDKFSDPVASTFPLLGYDEGKYHFPPPTLWLPNFFPLRNPKISRVFILPS